jgi:hypothetical protein
VTDVTFGKASIRRVAAVLLPLILLAASGSVPPAFDLVLTGGRVIDPETALDAIRDVGIRGDTVAQEFIRCVGASPTSSRGDIPEALNDLSASPAEPSVRDRKGRLLRSYRTRRICR